MSLENSRTICRSCRLQKCRDVGLRMAGKNLVVQFNGYPENDLINEDIDEISNNNRIRFTQNEQTTSNNVGSMKYVSFKLNIYCLVQQAQVQKKNNQTALICFNQKME